MENKIHSFFEGINNDIRLLDREVNEKSTRFNRFVKLILQKLDNLQERIIYEIKKRKREFAVDPFCGGLTDEQRMMTVLSVEIFETCAQ